MVSPQKLISTLFFTLLIAAAAAGSDTAKETTTPWPEATPRHFDGFYTALELGSQNVFSGAFLDNIDILTQDDRAIVELALGWRKQLKTRLVFGFELRYGVLDGDLAQTFLDTIEIEYRTDQQLSYRLILGWVLGEKRKTLLYGFLGEVEREFDLEIHTPLGTFGQTDVQSFEQFGLGLERNFGRRWGLRLTASTFDVDFGDLTTSIGIDQDLTLAAGMTLRLGRLGGAP